MKTADSFSTETTARFGNGKNRVKAVEFTYTEKELGKTQISHINRDFERGTCLIVGEKSRFGTKVKVDAVNIAIIRALSNTEQVPIGQFQLLDLAQLEPGEKVYLVAHGIFRTRRIDNRSLREIAEKLIEAGYDGSQSITILACDTDKKGIDIRSKFMGNKDSHKTMREELIDELEKVSTERGARIAKNHIHLSSYANGKTIVINREQTKGRDSTTTNADLWVVNPTEVRLTRSALMAQKFLMYYGGYYERLRLKKYKRGQFISTSSLYRLDESVLDSMDTFKFGLVKGFITGKKRYFWFTDRNVVVNVIQTILTALLGILIVLFGTGKAVYTAFPTVWYTQMLLIGLTALVEFSRHIKNKVSGLGSEIVLALIYSIFIAVLSMTTGSGGVASVYLVLGDSLVKAAPIIVAVRLLNILMSMF